LDEGGHYTPNAVQQATWAWWNEFWGEFVPVTTRKEPYDILLNGDWLDNEHHGAKTLISNNIEIQRRIAIRCMERHVEVCQKAGGRFYVTRGTGVHDGESGQDVERIAEELGAVPDATGKFSRWEMWKRIEGPDSHCLVHALHHIGTTGSAHYETSAPNRELVAEYVEAAQTAEEPPRFVIRSHRHRHTAVPLATIHGRAWCVVTPSWQGKTGFAYRVAGARISQPQFGGIILRNGDEEVYWREFWRCLSRPKIEV